jgi:zeaxanthin glucosyltransferase
MSRIVFLLDLEEGHFLATFKLAKCLRSRGHTIYYLGLANAEGLVRQQGFDFIPILDEVFQGVTRSADADFDVSSLQMALLRNRALDGVIERLRPDGMILLSLYPLESLLMHYRYGLPVVLLTTHCRPALRELYVESSIGERLAGLRSHALREVLDALEASGLGFRSFWQVTQAVLRMPELILVPRPFDLPELVDDPYVTYAGSGVDLARTEEPFAWETLDPRLPLVYCSLGSQCDVEAQTSRRFFQCVIDTAAARPDLQFLLSLSKGFSIAEFPAPSANLHLSNWVPQMTVLGRASLMVNHGGMGSVKECILQGVPMVVLPLVNDEFNCAQRVVHHGLGVQGDATRLTPDGLSALIDSVLTGPAFRQRIAAMQERFRETDDSRRGIEVIETAMASRPGVR